MIQFPKNEIFQENAMQLDTGPVLTTILCHANERELNSLGLIIVERVYGIEFM
jgi:hypothetical protein